MYAQSQPDKPAIIDDRGGDIRRLTFAELDDQATRLANVLGARGIVTGDKVAWCGQNSLGVVLFLSAARKLGITAVPVNYRFTDEEAAYVTDHSDSGAVYADAELAPLFVRIRSQLPKVGTLFVYDGAVPDSADLSWVVDADAAIAGASTDDLPEPEEGLAGSTMIYTSGTTGKPKGALRRSVNMEGAIALITEIGYTPDDLYLTTGPLYHSGPGGFLGIAQVLGQTVVTQRKFDPEDWLRLVETYGCTSTFSAPTPVRMVCNLPQPVIDRYDRSSLRIMIANAAPWSFSLKQRYVEVFPPSSLFEVYGSTELGVNTLLKPADQLRKPGSCGQPAPMVEIRLFDDDGKVVDGIGPEHTGELFVRSGSVFHDYYKQHDKYEEDQRSGGWQTVGDIAYLDDEGFVYICDRKKDMIISGGVNIYPAEIEAALEQHPDVYEVAVFGIPSEEWGEAVHAVVVAHPGRGLDEVAVTAFARQHLAGYKVPRSISWVDELPKTGSGKILKRELRAPFWAR